MALIKGRFYLVCPSESSTQKNKTKLQRLWGVTAEATVPPSEGYWA